MQKIRGILNKRDWVLSENQKMDVFSIPGLEVATDTDIYEKKNVGSSVGLEMPVFIFVSKLKFSKNIPSPGMELIRGIVKRESKKKFMDVLEERGLRDVGLKESKRQYFDETEINYFVYESCYTKEGTEYEIDSGCFVLHDSDKYYVLGYSKPRDNSILDLNSDQTIDMESEISSLVELIL